MSQWITLDTPHGPVRAWQALPDATPRAGLVVIQEIFGANAHIRHVAGQYAAAGYAVLAPAFFDPLAPGLELDYDAAGTARGKALVEILFDMPVVMPPLVMGLGLLLLFQTMPGRWVETSLGWRFTYTPAGVVLAQFAVACAFAIRSLRATFGASRVIISRVERGSWMPSSCL